jgi:hypothetical protein
MKDEIWPGDRVRVYDPRHESFREGVVLSRYGFVSYDMMRILGWSYETAQYPDCIDVQFADRISKGHFTEGVKKIENRQL